MSNITLKGRTDRGQVGEIECCKVKFAFHSWATATYSGVVRAHVADKCSDPIVLDKHCPCEKEMRHDNASNSFANLKKTLTYIEGSYLDFKKELYTCVLNFDIKNNL